MAHESENSVPSGLYRILFATGISLLSGPSTDTSSRWRSVLRRVWDDDIYRYDHKRALFVPSSRNHFRTNADVWACLARDVRIAFGKE